MWAPRHGESSPNVSDLKKGIPASPDNADEVCDTIVRRQETTGKSIEVLIFGDGAF